MTKKLRARYVVLGSISFLLGVILSKEAAQRIFDRHLWVQSIIFVPHSGERLVDHLKLRW